jgi:YVTN family beta-propeller protein
MWRAAGPATAASASLPGRRKGSSVAGRYVVALADGRGFTRDQYGGTVSAFALETLQPIGSVSVGEYPEGLEASADGRTIYVVNWFSNDGYAVDASALKITAEMKVGEGPRSFGLFCARPNSAALGERYAEIKSG